MNGICRSWLLLLYFLFTFCLVFPSRDRVIRQHPQLKPFEPIPTFLVAGLLEIVIVCFNLCMLVEITLYLITYLLASLSL